jgi:diacylglycerol kinase
MVFLVLISSVVVYIYEFEFWKIIILLMAGVVMLIVELVNSAIEKFLDLISRHHNDDIKYIKDVMAGAALVASLLWFLVFLLIIFY